MEYTKQDYQNALEIWLCFFYSKNHESYREYIDEKIDELEKSQLPVYRCIQLPPSYYGIFKLGQTYSADWRCCEFKMSDLPNHFELVEPEPEPEKITWQEVVTLIEGFKRTTFLPQGFYIELMKIINRIKTDYL